MGNANENVKHAISILEAERARREADDRKGRILGAFIFSASVVVWLALIVWFVVRLT